MLKLAKIIIIFSLGLLVFPLIVYSQHDHKHDLGSFEYFIPNVTYTIRADIIPESIIVKGMIEVEFNNYYNDSLSNILFHLDRPGTMDSDSFPDGMSYIFFDSILYYGAPLSREAVEFDGTNMLVNLPHTLQSDKRAFFLMSFTTKISEENLVADGDYFLNLSGWYPRVALKGDRGWIRQTDLSQTKIAVEYAKHYVGLRIDSAYNLVYAGKHLNEKEHLGLSSKQRAGDLRVDLNDNYSKDINGQKYNPVFEDGYKNYYINQPVTKLFNAIVRKELVHDRLLTDNLTIDVFYTENERKLWSKSVAELVSETVKFAESKIGKLKYKNISVCSSPIADKRYYVDPVIQIPEGINDREVLYSYIAARVIRLWFPSYFYHPYSEFWFNAQDHLDELSIFIVVDQLYKRGLDSDYKITTKLFEWLNIINNDDSANVAPSRFWILSYYLHTYACGEGWLFSNINWYLEDAYFDHRDGQGGIRFYTEFQENFDLELIDYQMLQTDSGYNLEIEFKSNYIDYMPYEIGIVTENSDTTIERIEYYHPGREFKSKKISKFLTQKPIAIILDPNYYLPDIDRSNNYGYFKMTKFNPHQEKPIFPGYYK